MDVTAAMVAFVVERRGWETRLWGSSDCVVEFVASLDEAPRERGALYVCGEGAPVRRPSSDASWCVLQVTVPAQVGKGDVPRMRHRVAMRSPLEEAAAAVRALDRWDARLKDALLQQVPLAEFMHLGAEMFASPIAYFDRNLITLASSEDYWDRGGDSGDSGLRGAGQMPSELAVDLVEDVDYLAAAERVGPFYYRSTQGRMFCAVNTFDNGEYLARLVMAMPQGVTRLCEGEERLFAHYHELLDRLYLHYAGNVDIVQTQNDALHTLVRSALLEGKSLSTGEAASVLSSYGWERDDGFMAVKLVFFEGVHWDSISLYLCGLLERAMAASCAFPVEQQIAWLVNVTRSRQLGEAEGQCIDRLVETLVSVMRDYACKAGISDRFSPPVRARAYYLEAERALDVGQSRDPHRWYYRFSDYALDYVLGKGTEELEPAQVCHPALATLLAHDRDHGTAYARTLVCYLRNSQNATHTADELFIHRTSFMRRMAHMRTLAAFDLDDPDEVLHLLLSAKLLDP